MLSLLLLLILSFYNLDTTIVPVFGFTDTQTEIERPRINLTSFSAPRFFECGVTPANGTAILPGQSNEDNSAQSVLTDRDLDTIIMGKAEFDVSSNSSIVNAPGPDLVLVEMENSEPLNVSISSAENRNNKWLVLKPTPSNGTDSNTCQYGVNNLFIDLSSFGIPEGFGVPSVRIANLGFAGTLKGSDIAEIYILEPQISGAPSESSMGNIPFFRQN